MTPRCLCPSCQRGGVVGFVYPLPGEPTQEELRERAKAQIERAMAPLMAKAAADRHRATCLAMSRFLVWVWMEARAQASDDVYETDARRRAVIDAIEWEFFRLEWA